MKFEIGKLYKLKTNISPTYDGPLQFFNSNTSDSEQLETGAILLFVGCEHFYKTEVSHFIYNNTLYLDSYCWSLSRHSESIFEKVEDE